MSLSTALATVAALGVGMVGAVTAYQISAPEPVAQPSSALEAPRVRPQPKRVRYAPCRPPAEPRGRLCVTQQTRTVVLPPPAGGTAPVSVPAPTRVATAAVAAVAPHGTRHTDDDHHDDDHGFDDPGGDDHGDDGPHGGEGEQGHHGDDDDGDDRDDDRDHDDDRDEDDRHEDDRDEDDDRDRDDDDD